MSWREINLGDAIYVKHGFAFKGEFFSDQGDYIVLTPGNFYEEGGFRIRPGKDRFYTGEFPADYILKVDDLIVAMTEQGPGLLGSSAIVPEDNRFLHNQRLGLIQEIDESKLEKRFLYYLFNTRSVRGQISGSATGTKVRHTAPERIYRVKATVPSDVAEQKKISSILSVYDKLIDNNVRRIQLLEHAAQLLFREWFVHFHFPGHEHIKYENGIPQGWHRSSILEHPHFEFISSSVSRYDGQKRYYATADINGIYIVGEGKDYSYEDKPSRAQKLPALYSVWFARMQETFKVLVFTNANIDLVENAMLSSGFVGFRALKPEYLPFLYLAVNNKYFHKEKDRYCSGATQRALTNSGLRSVQVIVPPQNLLRTFSLISMPMIEQMLILQSTNRKLKIARELLLPRLMNGEITV